MKISVIIPTYNEESVIKDCILSLKRQSLDDFEIIIVDDGSRDKTIKILKSLKGIKLFKQDHKGPGAARNLGAKHARGKILVFVDADMTFDRDFLKKLTKTIIEGKTKGTFSKEEYVSNWDNIWARCWNTNEGWMPKRRHPENYPDKQKVFRAILKSKFNKVGGFTPGGYTDDWSLSEKLGYLAVNAPGAKFYHKNPGSLKEVFNHAKWVGKRPYKLGVIGIVVAIIRSLFPISMIKGIVGVAKSSTPNYFIFKIIYDFGILWGIINSFITRRLSK